MAKVEGTTVDKPGLAAVLGANVYRLRVLKVPKWSQSKLATLAGLSRETIRIIEDARDPDREPANNIRLDTLEAIANALAVDPAELLRWDSTTPPYLSGQRLALIADPSATPSPRRRPRGQLSFDAVAVE